MLLPYEGYMFSVVVEVKNKLELPQSLVHRVSTFEKFLVNNYLKSYNQSNKHSKSYHGIRTVLHYTRFDAGLVFLNVFLHVTALYVKYEYQYLFI